MSEYYRNITDGQGRVVGRVLVSDGSGFPPQKNRYTFKEFVEACTEDEWDVIEELAVSGTANQKKKARRVLRVWMSSGVDFNEAQNQSIMTWLVNNTAEWTAERAAELVG